MTCQRHLVKGTKPLDVGREACHEVTDEEEDGSLTASSPRFTVAEVFMIDGECKKKQLHTTLCSLNVG